MPKQQSRKVGLYEIEWRTVSIRTIQIFLLVITGLTAFVGYWFWFRENVPQVQEVLEDIETAARFIDYDGKVEVKPREEFVWKAASFKLDLHEGDRIRTAPNSTAKIKFEDGTEVTVQTDSLVIINKRSLSSESDTSPLAMWERGEGDINAKKSSSAPSVSTGNIKRFKLAPGSLGSVSADVQTGEHRGSIQSGYGELTDTRGNIIQLRNLEEVKIERGYEPVKLILPSPPPLLSPTKGQEFEFLTEQPLTVELKWRDVSNAARYHIQISESFLFGKLSAENATLAKSSIVIKIPKTLKKQYFWRVRCIDKDRNKSPWSEPFQFVVFTPNIARNTGSGDKTPPLLQITYMHPFLPFVQVEGNTEPDAVLTLNDQIIDVREDGSFTFNYTLQQSGWNDLKFVAEDPAGNKTAITKKVQF